MKPISRWLSLMLLMVICTVGRADFPVRISGQKAWLPAVAYNSTDHEYLVVWSEDLPTIPVTYNYLFGQRVSESGTMLGNPFVVFYYGVNPVVAYNSSAHEYLVGFNPGGGFVGQRVGSDGTLLGSPTQLMDGAAYGRLMYNSLTGQYLFVGADIRETLPSGGYTMKIYSRKIGSDGQAVNSPVIVDSLQFSSGTDADGKFSAAFAPIQSTETPNGRYLLAIVAYGTMFLEYLDSNGTPFDAVSDPYHAGVTYRYVPFKTGSPLGGLYNVDVAYGDQSGYSMTGPAFLVVWADQNNTFSSQSWTGIWGGFVDASKIAYSTTDVISDYAFPISAIADHWTRDPEIATYRPQAAYNPSSEKFYVVWREMPGTSPYNNATVNHIRGNYVFESIPAHNVVISATNGTEDPHRPALAASTSSEHALVVWEDYRNGVCNIYGNVEKVADAVPPTPVSGQHVVTNTLDGGPGSLRQAILDANAHAGTDSITFNIPGSGVHTIMPTTPLPVLTDVVLIDGYTQSGAHPNTQSLQDPDDAVLNIVIDGSSMTNPTNKPNGLQIKGGNSCVRGLVINGFPGVGIFVDSLSNNVLEGNFIGTDNLAQTAKGNAIGVMIGFVNDNTIGGLTAAARNIISGNQDEGVVIDGNGIVIQGNYIGTDITGKKSLPNGADGVLTWGDNTFIGGAADGAANVISGNGGAGIRFFPAHPYAGCVQGNRLGTQADGVSPLGNGGSGIHVYRYSQGVLIGGTAAGEANIIAYNGGDGVRVGDNTASATPPTGTRIIGNAIFANSKIGINLVGGTEDNAGVTANDAGDADTGPNGLQNYPVLTFGIAGDNLSLQGSLNSKANTTYRVEFFSTRKDSTNTGHEGKNFLGWTGLTTDGNGNASFDATLGSTVDAAHVVTATATDPNGNTSEFSAPIAITLFAGKEVVSTTADTGLGSLRQAILNANAKNAGDTIGFNIPGSGVQTIRPTSPLPEITARVVIDGYTQPGSSVNTSALSDGDNAVLKIAIDGSLAGTSKSALRLSGGGSVVRGLAIGNFTTTTAVEINGDGGCRVEGCFLGTDAAGLARADNYQGVLLSGVGYNTVGGANAAQRNIISGSGNAGVILVNRTTSNAIQGNYIGVDASGKKALGQMEIGIEIDHAPSNSIGGSLPGAGNVISGHGTAKSQGMGIRIGGAESRGNMVSGNIIGASATGIDTVANNQHGVVIEQSACANIIGGTSQAARNIVSGNAWLGVWVLADSNVVCGNYIGTDITGSKALPNGNNGIYVEASGNTIGGSSASAGNLVSGNNAAGIEVRGMVVGSPFHDDIIQANRIGTQSDGSSPLGNKGPGVLVRSWVEGIMIGGRSGNAGNIIAFNEEEGVRVDTDTLYHWPSPYGICISRNSIFGNGCLGINLVGGSENAVGVTMNDQADADTGANCLQNYPVLTAVSGGSSLWVQGRLNSLSNAAFTLEFFATPVNGTLLDGEGQTFVGSTGARTDGSGNAYFDTTFGIPVAAGRAITVTATDTLGNTSEFSLPKVVTTTGIAAIGGIPSETSLMQNYPNPFNPKTVISGQWTVDSRVRLVVYDLLGREVGVLADGKYPAGRYAFTFDGSHCSSGVYFYRLTVGATQFTKSMILMK